LATLLVAGNAVFLAQLASAATLTNTYVRLTRMKANTDSTVRVVFKTTSNAGATGVTVDFNGTDTGTARWTDGANSGTVSTTQAITGTSGCDVSATALPGSLSASGSGAVVTVTGVTALSANTLYCFDLTTSNSVHTPTTTGEYHPTITETGGATDSTTVALRVVSNDQITVNATVPPSFNFAISGCSSNTDSFTTNLTASTHTSTSGCTVTVNTNALNGWFAWAKDSSSGLNSATASHTIATTTAGSQADLNSSHGTEGYGLAITAVSQGGSCAGTCGTTSAAAAYDSTASSGNNGLVGGIDTSNRLIASSTGVANAATLTVKERANINATTPPATDYTDLITVIGAGNF
jgi:hypothetical protein